MVAVTAILGTISLGLMIDSNNIPGDLMTNGAYYAFQKLGEYYKVGNIFVILYAITNMIGQFAVLIISIDAPLRMLLNSGDRKYIPEKLFVRNKNGAYVNGHKLIFIIVSILIIVPAMGIGSVDELVRWLVKLNAVCMPLRYLWVFVAYIALKRTGDKFEREYYFVKNKTLGIIIGVWCFAFTTFACVGGMYSEDKFQLILNIATPFILILLGFILPQFAKKNKAVVTSKDEVSA
jgi:amino acid transporter